MFIVYAFEEHNYTLLINNIIREINIKTGGIYTFILEINKLYL